MVKIEITIILILTLFLTNCYNNKSNMKEQRETNTDQHQYSNEKDTVHEIMLNHTIVPTRNNIESANFYTQIFGFDSLKVWGNFAVVRVNSSLTLDFMNYNEIQEMHLAFKVNNDQFDDILKRIKSIVKIYGSNYENDTDGKINYHHGGRGVYFRDLDGHSLEILTADYIIE